MSDPAPIPKQSKTTAMIVAVICFFGSINSFMFAFTKDMKFLFIVGAFFFYWMIRMIKVYQRPAETE